MKNRRFTIRDMLVMVAIIAVLLALLLPLIQSYREEARRMTCRYKFQQVLLAMHNYHAAYKNLPSAMAGTSGNANRLSGLIALTQFYGATSPWEGIRTPRLIGGVQYPGMGSVPWDKKYKPWTTGFSEYICPSDPLSVCRWFWQRELRFLYR